MTKCTKRKSPKTILKLPDLEQSKIAVLNSLASPSSRRSYEHAIRDFTDWYCSEPRLAFNKTVVTRYRISLEQRRYAPATINLRLAAVRRLAYEASDCGLLSPDLAAGDTEGQGCKETGRPCRELAFRQARQSPHLRTRWAGASERAESSGTCHAHWVWSAPG